MNKRLELIFQPLILRDKGRLKSKKNGGKPEIYDFLCIPLPERL